MHAIISPISDRYLTSEGTQVFDSSSKNNVTDTDITRQRYRCSERQVTVQATPRTRS